MNSQDEEKIIARIRQLIEPDDWVRDCLDNLDRSLNDILADAMAMGAYFVLKDLEVWSRTNGEISVSVAGTELATAWFKPEGPQSTSDEWGLTVNLKWNWD